MTNIYAKSEEKFVKTTIVYADADDGHLFWDEAKSVKMTKDEVLDLFLKGMTIKHETTHYRPTSYSETGGYSVVTVMSDSSDTATPLTFHSKEKS